MTLELDKRILDLNIKEAGAKMPAETLHALKIGSEAINYIIRLRACSLEHRNQKLPSEIVIPDLAPSADRKNRLRESPLGREPKG